MLGVESKYVNGKFYISEMSSKKKAKSRADYMKNWQAKRRKKLADQGFKEIRIVVHRDYEYIIRNLAKRDYERRIGNDD